MTITEKVAYLKGMADGMELDKESGKEAKLLKVVIDVLEEIGYAIEDLEEADELLHDGLDAVSEDLEDVESLLFDEDDEDEDDCDCDCCCGDDFFEVECPNCGADLVIDDAVLLKGKIECPGCEETFSLDFVDEDEDEEDED